MTRPPQPPTLITPPSPPTTPHPKPPRLPHSTSDPLHLTSGLPLSPASTSNPSPTHQQVYVLSADGSQLFLIDPSRPSSGEEPPPYAPFHRPANANATAQHDTRHRASTLSALSAPPAPAAVALSGSSSSSHRRTNEVDQRSRPRFHSSFSHHQPPTSGRDSVGQRRSRSTMSSPAQPTPAFLPDETTPLLARSADALIQSAEGDAPLAAEDSSRRRGFWRSVFCGELDDDEDVGGWGMGFRRFWRVCGEKPVWAAMAHLWFLNFPFALAIWPFLVAGTLAGTALLITLPIGAAVWWLTLFLARSSARLEMIMQTSYHSPLSPTIPPPTYHPIFHRLKERSAPTSPLSTSSAEPPTDTTQHWERRFTKCSYAMFCDHYSYSALSYFLLIKPLCVLFPTIILWALFPVMAATIVGLPVYLRAARRWGRYQAGVAVENL